MNDGHGHWYSQELTEEQALRLRKVAYEAKARNWAWLAQWLDPDAEHEDMNLMGKPPTAEAVVKLYEQDKGWERFESGKAAS